MKNTVVIFGIAASLVVASCNGNTADTTTQMPDSGYKQRTDSVSNIPPATESNPHGAAGVDSVSGANANVSGVPDSLNKKKDSIPNK